MATSNFPYFATIAEATLIRKSDEIVYGLKYGSYYSAVIVEELEKYGNLVLIDDIGCRIDCKKSDFKIVHSVSIFDEILSPEARKEIDEMRKVLINYSAAFDPSAIGYMNKHAKAAHRLGSELAAKTPAGK